ncbi:hypothetical protein F9L03_21775 [Brucella lupini]|uniref:Uncharacterized protein n=1 Tax=Brucella lupini TaxID=255457 RepID=A0AB34DEW4_9HYPH|nr:hypothetical protein F9L03_21775 [Brucella lupini]
MDTGRTGNLGDHRVRLKAGRDEALFVFASPTTTALNGRDHLNWILRHMTTPSVTTRTGSQKAVIARRPSPWAYRIAWAWYFAPQFKGGLKLTASLAQSCLFGQPY